jgi:Ca-activated chloride channel homolog
MIARSAKRPSLVLSFLLTLAWAALSTASNVWAQSSDEVHIAPRPQAPSAEGVDSEPMKPMRVDVNLVLVPVTVTDPMNRPVLTLQQQDFALYEGGTQQKVLYFSHEDVPISMGLVLDCSSSMKNKIEYEAQAVQEFFNNANSEDEYFAVTVSTKPQLIASATNSVGTLQERLASSPPSGRTALFDAIYLAIAKMRAAHYQRRALLIISDGGDNTSHYTRDEIKKVIEESDVLTYAIGIFDEEPIPLLKTIEERMGRNWLSELTDAGGGRTIAADDRTKIPEIAAMVSTELRSEYVLGYRSGNPVRDGKWRKIVVKVAPPSSATHLQVHYREGYKVPSE